MRVLFVHQNFPGQFRFNATALAADKRNQIVALSINPPGYPTPGVVVGRYPVKRKPTDGVPPLLADFQSKVLRGEAAAAAAFELKQKGFEPDVIVAHPGWGEQLFLKDIWPQARMLCFMEFFYRSEGLDTNFDPEFPTEGPSARARTRVKNANHLLALDATDWCYSPTHWQRSSLPEVYLPKTSVIFDGIDTEYMVPDPQAAFTLPDGRVVKAGDEVLTFVNRNLEPYRGFHTFMRALPAIQKARPNAISLIVGGDEVSYGTMPANAKNWREAMLAEVGDKLDLTRVAFLGRIPYPDYRKLIQVSRAHVYLTYPFVLSWSMLESLSAECLVIGSSTPPVREVLSHERNGLLVDFFDIDGWVKTVVKALDRPADYSPLRTAARKRILEAYDLKTVCLPRQFKLIEALANKAKPSALSRI